MDNFNLKKYLVENKLTKQSTQKEGFRDMFQKSKPSETFQGSSKEEFIKWATLVFNKKGIPKDDYDYFLSDVDSSYNWDESYKGISQDELVNYHLKPWLLRNNFSADEYSYNDEEED